MNILDEYVCWLIREKGIKNSAESLFYEKDCCNEHKIADEFVKLNHIKDVNGWVAFLLIQSANNYFKMGKHIIYVRGDDVDLELKGKMSIEMLKDEIDYFIRELNFLKEHNDKKYILEELSNISMQIKNILYDERMVGGRK